MSQSLSLQNRQRDVRVNTRLLRRLVQTLLRDLLNRRDYELAVRLVSAAEITRINESYLGHIGVTDVITFDYALEGAGGDLVGDIVICAAEAVVQARQFHTPWPVELTRYAVHGVLHLLGYDDRRAQDRRRMKKVEDRLVRELGQRFDLEQLEVARGIAFRPRIPRRRAGGRRGSEGVTAAAGAEPRHTGRRAVRSFA